MPWNGSTKVLLPVPNTFTSTAWPYLFLAMAHSRLGEKEEAAQAMYKARILMDERFPKLDRGQLLDKE